MQAYNIICYGLSEKIMALESMVAVLQHGATSSDTMASSNSNKHSGSNSSNGSIGGCDGMTEAPQVCACVW